jgi:hypothetical protein
MQQAFLGLGVGQGDRVAGLMPNMPETIAATPAAASIGAVWSSASPDFGPRGALDRFGQIAPKLFIAADGYYYAGKVIDNPWKIAVGADFAYPECTGRKPAGTSTWDCPQTAVASGARITTHLIDALSERKKRYGLGSACIGGGQGIALIVESLPQ